MILSLSLRSFSKLDDRGASSPPRTCYCSYGLWVFLYNRFGASSPLCVHLVHYVWAKVFSSLFVSILFMRGAKVKPWLSPPNTISREISYPVKSRTVTGLLKTNHRAFTTSRTLKGEHLTSLLSWKRIKGHHITTSLKLGSCSFNETNMYWLLCYSFVFIQRK